MSNGLPGKSRITNGKWKIRGDGRVGRGVKASYQYRRRRQGPTEYKARRDTRVHCTKSSVSDMTVSSVQG